VWRSGSPIGLAVVTVMAAADPASNTSGSCSAPWVFQCPMSAILSPMAQAAISAVAAGTRRLAGVQPQQPHSRPGWPG
jgi:hypothetical protein